MTDSVPKVESVSITVRYADGSKTDYTTGSGTRFEVDQKVTDYETVGIHVSAKYDLVFTLHDTEAMNERGIVLKLVTSAALPKTPGVYVHDGYLDPRPHTRQYLVYQTDGELWWQGTTPVAPIKIRDNIRKYGKLVLLTP